MGTLVEAINAETVKEQFPQWQNLECESGHRYLFSEDERVWDDALAECTLYGGWLANIGSIWEQTCIFVDEHTGADIEWFSPRWTGGEGPIDQYGGDAIMICLTHDDPRSNGRWADYYKNSPRKFICEGL